MDTVRAGQGLGGAYPMHDVGGSTRKRITVVYIPL